MNERLVASETIIAPKVLTKSIGLIGLSLPFVLVIGGFILGNRIENSISAYYYTGMRSIFIGSLFMMGIIMWAYQGYPDKNQKITDDRAGHLAAAFAIGVALFPMAPEISPSGLDRIIGGLH
jgi:undecaprenyl pyrophosphate phosphatase UppP